MKAAARLQLRDIEERLLRAVCLPTAATVGAQLTAPGKELVGIEIVTPRDFGKRDTIRNALVNDPALLIQAP